MLFRQCSALMTSFATWTQIRWIWASHSPPTKYWIAHPKPPTPESQELIYQLTLCSLTAAAQSVNMNGPDILETQLDLHSFFSPNMFVSIVEKHNNATSETPKIEVHAFTDMYMRPCPQQWVRLVSSHCIAWTSQPSDRTPTSLLPATQTLHHRRDQQSLQCQSAIYILASRPPFEQSLPRATFKWLFWSFALHSCC